MSKVYVPNNDLVLEVLGIFVHPEEGLSVFGHDGKTFYDFAVTEIVPYDDEILANVVAEPGPQPGSVADLAQRAEMGKQFERDMNEFIETLKGKKPEAENKVFGSVLPSDCGDCPAKDGCAAIISQLVSVTMQRVRQSIINDGLIPLEFEGNADRPDFILRVQDGNTKEPYSLDFIKLAGQRALHLVFGVQAVVTSVTRKGLGVYEIRGLVRNAPSPVHAMREFYENEMEKQG